MKYIKFLLKYLWIIFNPRYKMYVKKWQFKNTKICKRCFRLAGPHCVTPAINGLPPVEEYMCDKHFREKYPELRAYQD